MTNEDAQKRRVSICNDTNSIFCASVFIHSHTSKENMTNKLHTFLVFLISIATLVSSCHKEESSFTLEVDIHGFTDTTAILYGVFNQPDSIIHLPIKNGKLKHVIPMDTLTPMYLLLDDGKRYSKEIPLFADKGTTIRIEGDTSHWEHLKIKGGGEEQKLYQTFLSQWIKEDTTKGIEEIADSFISTHPLSVVSVLLVKEYVAQSPNANKTQIEKAIKQLSGKMQDHPYVLRLQDDIKEIKDNHTNKTFYFTAWPDTIGRNLTPKDLKENYVVLSFWASWHTESREMLDSLKKTIGQFNKEPVKFVHLSLDSNHQNWLDSVRADSISGIHTCTLLGWKDPTVISVGVTSLPHNIVISPQNRIIGVNMRGAILEKFLTSQIEQYRRKKKK